MAHTILFADDSQTIRRAAEIAFAKQSGYELHQVADGDAAIARAKELKPNVVVADHSMPGKDGYQVAEALKADPATANVKVVILSGSSADFDAGRATGAGAENLAKPFDCATLFAKVANLCGENVETPSTSPFAHLKPAGSSAPEPSATAAVADEPAAPATPPAAATPPVTPPVAPVTPPVAPVTPPAAPVTPPVAPAAPIARAAPIAAAPAAASGGDLASAVVAQAAAAVTQKASAAISASAGNGATPSEGEIGAAAREIIERVVWEVVPELAETLIKEEIQRLLAAR